MRGPVKLRHGRTDGRASGAITYLHGPFDPSRVKQELGGKPSHGAHQVQAEEEGGGGRGGRGLYKCPGLFSSPPLVLSTTYSDSTPSLSPSLIRYPIGVPSKTAHIYPDDARPNFLTPRQAFPLFHNKQRKHRRHVRPKLRRAYPHRPFTPSKQRTGSIDARLPLSPLSLSQDAGHQRDSGRFHAADDGEDQHKHCDAHPVPHRGADQAQGGDGRLYVWSPSPPPQ